VSPIRHFLQLDPGVLEEGGGHQIGGAGFRSFRIQNALHIFALFTASHRTFRQKMIGLGVTVKTQLAGDQNL
jgi:hypothetical protein